MNKRILKIAAYTRISTDEEHQRYSLSAQEERIRNYISFHKKDGYSLFKIYSDQKSGASLNRPGLQNLLQDAEKGLFDVILVVKMDRLLRNLAHQLYLFGQFQKWNIKLMATDEDIDLETPDGVTWTQIRGAFNEAERRKISYRTKMGMRKKASLGGWCGGYTPFGYNYEKNTKSLIPHKSEMMLVKEIFSLYVRKKMGAKSIAAHLNKKGYRTGRGHRFSTSAIIAIITNPIYAGKIRWGGQTYPGVHQPLIDEQIFDKAQVILAQRRGNSSLRRSNASDYPLSGLLHCEECGRNFVGINAHGRNDIYKYYACPGKFKYGECQMKNLPKEKIDRAVFSQIKKIFADSRFIKNLLNRVNTKRAEKVPRKKAELNNMKREIARKQSIIQKYLSAFESGTLDAVSCNERVKQLENEVLLLQERKTQLQKEIASSKARFFTMNDVQRAIGKLDEVIVSARPSEKKAFLRNIIKTIKVYSPLHIEPYYRIPVVRIMPRLAPRTGLEPVT